MTTITSRPRQAAHWIAGSWLPAAGSDPIRVIDPSTQQQLAQVAAGTAADANRAVDAAAEAFLRWSRVPLPDRLRVVQQLVAGLERRSDDLVEAIVSEVGSPRTMAQRTQVGMAIGMAGTFLKIAADYEFEYQVGNSLVRRQPAGVVAAITPWNMPLLLTLQKIVPALLAGCTVVHKPSELTPLHAWLLAEVLAETDLPPGAYNQVVGTGPVVGAALARHPRVDVVSLTGSTRAGRDVARNAAEGLKHVHLELGGKNASVILDDAPLERAVRANVDQVCFNTGQTCLQWSRLLVPEDRHDDAVTVAKEAMSAYRVGDPRDPATDLGPLVSAAARERVVGYIERAVRDGARLAAGGPERPDGLDRGWYVRPTLFADVDNGMEIAQEEVFGPVLCVIPYRDEQHAIELANDSRYGLHGAVWSATDARALEVAQQLRTGLVDINGGAFNPLAPFGGLRDSGVGRECGTEGFASYLETTSYQLPDGGDDVIGPRLRGES